MERKNKKDKRLHRHLLINELELNKFNLEDINRDILRLENKIRKGKEEGVYIDAIEDYRCKQNQYINMKQNLENSEAKRNTFLCEYEDLRKFRLNEFMIGFNEISLGLKKIYRLITTGGDAELELVDSLNPFSEGVVFSV